MPKQRVREIKSNKPEKTTGQFRPRELERYPEMREYREVSQNKRIETQFKEKTGSKRVLGLPRVEGFEKSGIISNQEVKDYLKDEFSERHANNVTMETVRYNDKFIKEKEKTELAHWEKKEAAPGIGVFNKEIVVNRQMKDGNIDRKLMKDNIAHEVGHQVHNMYLEKRDQQEWIKITRDMPKDKFVSEYAKKDHFEDFAESYRYYLRNPEELKKASVEKYDFMRDHVFSGREYITGKKIEIYE